MTKPERQPNTRRRQFIQLLNSVDRYWMDVLGDNLFHDLNYYDLFTQMWLRLSDRSCDAFYKSELYQLMPHISQRTAIKYIQIAIDHGLLIEEIDTDDLRSRKITMSENLKQKIELFLDHSISIFEAAPSPTSKPEVSTTGDEAIE
ncbi:MAG: MarR family transcriptional regulator [Nitrosomonas sp.]|nr:MarR family transcriptional regulator [Nitrosomonas sp.]